MVNRYRRDDRDVWKASPNLPWLYLAARIIKVAQEDFYAKISTSYDTRSIKRNTADAIIFFSSDWYWTLYDYCCTFNIGEGFLQALLPPKELWDELHGELEKRL